MQHRNRIARDYVIVSRVILLGYSRLSDGAKVTYWVIYGHDWHEPSRGGRKGYAYPTIRRLAQLRRTTDRTIQRHLVELTEAGLLTRQIRPGQASILYIEEPSEEEIERYIGEHHGRGDVSVGGGVTKMSPTKKEEEKQTKDVNGVLKESMEERSGARTAWASVREILRPSRRSSATSRRQEWLADQALAATGDRQSLGCYRAIAARCPEGLVFEAISLLKEARRYGGVRSRGAFFVATVRRLCHERGLADPLGQRAGSSAQSAPHRQRTEEHDG